MGEPAFRTFLTIIQYESDSEPASTSGPSLDTRIEDYLNWTGHSKPSLKVLMNQGGVKTLGDLLKMRESDLKDLHGFGRFALRDLMRKLEADELHLAGL